MALITAISGSTITVTPPLIWSFAPNPVVLYGFIGINRFVGLEDMKVDHAEGRSGASFMIDQCYGCWVRGMTSYKPGSCHSYVLDSLRGEIRDSYFLDSQTYGSNNAGLNVRGTTNSGVNQGAVTGFKFENNIFDKTFPGIVLQNAASGNYLGNNYGYATQAGDYSPGDTYVAWNTGMFNDNHGPHDMMNLWEGNTGEQFTSDGYHGSASHGTLFRNHFTGLNPRFQIAWNAISLNRWSYHYNVVGNVLGVSSPRAATYQFGDTASCYAGKGIYRLRASRAAEGADLPASAGRRQGLSRPGLAQGQTAPHQPLNGRRLRGSDPRVTAMTLLAPSARGTLLGMIEAPWRSCLA